jgi:hypothetical protein
VACQDLNLGPYPYQAHSRDAFILLVRRMPVQSASDGDRGCPLATVRVRLIWHAGGTAGENETTIGGVGVGIGLCAR